jgi:hypothetical protein
MAIGYTPTHNFFGTDSFGVQVSDGTLTDTITVNVTVSRPVAALKANATFDGWVLESAEGSNLGGTLNSGSSFLFVGDDAANRQYRAILSFNTGLLPDNAVITSVTLRIRKQGQVGAADPFLTLGNILVDVKTGNFGAAALQALDFQTAGSKNGAFGITKSPSPVKGWYSRTLSPANRAFINKVGNTQLRLRFTLDDNNNLVANYLKFYSGNAPADSRPILIIQYYVP